MPRAFAGRLRETAPLPQTRALKFALKSDASLGVALGAALNAALNGALNVALNVALTFSLENVARKSSGPRNRDNFREKSRKHFRIAG